MTVRSSLSLECAAEAAAGRSFDLDLVGVTDSWCELVGYRLVTPIEWLDAGVIARRLGPKAGLFDLRIDQVCGSTNTALLRAAAQGAPSGTVLATELQNAGRGLAGPAAPQAPQPAPPPNPPLP